jgi:hypothetical protein
MSDIDLSASRGIPLTKSAAEMKKAREENAKMFKLITTMRWGSSTRLGKAWPGCPTIAAARPGTAALLRDDRILRVMIVRDEIPPAYVEWAER